MFRLYAFTLGLLSGIGLLVETIYFADLIISLALILSLITLILYHPRFKSFRCYGDFILAAAIGYGWAYIHILAVLSHALPEQYMDKPVILRGEVIHLPRQLEQNHQFDFQLTSICETLESCTPHDAIVRLNWRCSTCYIEPGQLLLLKAQLKPPSILANPGSRNQSKTYFLARISAIGSVKELISVVPAQAGRGFSDRVRQLCLKKITPLIESLAFGRFLEALTLGVRQNFNKSDWEIFQKTGTSHLMAISGLHIGLVASLFWWLGQKLWSLSFRATCRLPAQLVGGGFGLVAALIYSLLAGFSIPTQRALLMIAVVVLAKSFRRKLSFAQIVCFAILAIALWDVLALYSEGFWLSVIAVFFLLALSQNPSRFASVKLQFSLLIAMLPLSLLFFSQLSLVAPFSNFFAIPIVGWGVVPLSLLGVVLSFVSTALSSWCFYIADRIFAFIWMLLDVMSSWPLFYEFSISVWQFILLSIGCALLLLPKGIPLRWVGFLGFFPIIFNPIARPKMGEAWFYLMDVGQGLAAILQTRNHILLFDTGPQYGQTDAGDKVLWPFLREKRLKHIDAVVLSHADLDHIGGFKSLSQKISIGQVLSSEPNQFNGLWDNQSCAAGQKWYWDGVEFEILHPAPDFKGKKNERSCVLSITVGEHKILISGDIEKQGEAKLLRYEQAKLQSNILVVPHHGSLTSSTQAFVDAVAPQYALIAAGAFNRYGHPRNEIVTRYLNSGSTVLTSYQTGAICFKLEANQPIKEPILWRNEKRKVWDIAYTSTNTTNFQ